MGSSVQCERTLEYVVEPLNIRTSQIDFSADYLGRAMEYPGVIIGDGCIECGAEIY